MRAIALVSGGLDSVLAAYVMHSQNIEVIPVYFHIPFCHVSKSDPNASVSNVRSLISQIGLKLDVVDISSDFLRLINSPTHGFGANMNPCIDCKILMLKKAKSIMSDFGAFFVITGEVLGQRPMSQNKSSLRLIEEESGLEGLLVRPLSGKLMPATIPEEKGWIRREALLSMSGRSRKPQIELAKKIGLNGYPNPAGGCLLTDPEFSKRLKELIRNDDMNLENVQLLKFGRHFRLRHGTKIIVGRDERESNLLISLARPGDYLFMPPEDVAGPTCIGRGLFDEGLLNTALGIASYYCDDKKEVVCRRFDESQTRVLQVAPLDKNEIIRLRI